MIGFYKVSTFATPLGNTHHLALHLMTLTRCATKPVAHFGRTFWSPLFQRTFNFLPYRRHYEQVGLDKLAHFQRTFNFHIISFQGGGKARRILFVAFMLAHRILPVAFVPARLTCTLRFSTAQMHPAFQHGSNAPMGSCRRVVQTMLFALTRW